MLRPRSEQGPRFTTPGHLRHHDPVRLVIKINRLATSLTATTRSAPSRYTDTFNIVLDSWCVDNCLTLGQAECAKASALMLLCGILLSVASDGSHVSLTHFDDVDFNEIAVAPCTDQLLETISDVSSQFEGYDPNLIPLRPATELTGIAPEGGVKAILNKEEMEKWVANNPDIQMGGNKTGANLLGKSISVRHQRPPVHGERVHPAHLRYGRPW